MKRQYREECDKVSGVWPIVKISSVWAKWWNEYSASFKLHKLCLTNLRRKEKLADSQRGEFHPKPNWNKHSTANNHGTILLPFSSIQSSSIFPRENKETKRLSTKTYVLHQRGWESFGVKRRISIYLRQAEDWLQPGEESTKVISSGETIRLSEIGRWCAANSWWTDEQRQRYGVRAKGRRRARIKTRLEGPRSHCLVNRRETTPFTDVR